MILLGDAAVVLKDFEDGCIDLTVTSPPYYNARDYSQYPTYTAYLEALEEIIKQIERVTKEGRFFIINTSPIIEPRLSRSNQSKRYGIPFDLHHIITKNGFDFIDDIVWVKPSGAAINRNAGFYQHRTPLAYKPNQITEYIMVYRKTTDRLIDWNMRQYSKEVVDTSKVKEYEQTNVWYINPSTDDSHPATFPEELTEKLILYYSFVGDMVLDPFCGSGTTCLSAHYLDRRWIGIEINSDYVSLIKKRLTPYVQQQRLTQFLNPI